MALRPVKARAALSAIRFASVPELVKRTMSSEGKRSHMISASRPSRGVGPPSDPGGRGGSRVDRAGTQTAGGEPPREFGGN